jgi:hypothetical protein
MAASLLAKARSLIATVRAHPALNPAARTELAIDRTSRHPVDPDHLPHLNEAVAWLCRAQDATQSGGFARGYSLVFNPYFRSSGWQAAYPETTGYIIPTLLEASRELGDPSLAHRALRAADWEVDLQLETGAVQGGVVGEGRSPAVFNTGQVIFGWLAAWEHAGNDKHLAAADRAARWLVEVQEADGLWRKGNSRFALSAPTLYNARVAWALAEAGVALDNPGYLHAAGRNLRAVANQARTNGWLPHCCLTDPDRPLLHTLAYAVRGLVEGGRVLGDSAILEAGSRTAQALTKVVEPDGRMSGRYESDWTPAVPWSCLTGQVHMANNWMRLATITGDDQWLEPVESVIRFVKSTQNRLVLHEGLRGGIKGSWPVDGGYGRFEMLNWAAKYFVDALIRSRQLAEGRASERSQAYRLA